MTEAEWLGSTDPAAMLRQLTHWSDGLMAKVGGSAPSARKLRLFACACCQAVWDRLHDDAPCSRCGGTKQLLIYPTEIGPTTRFVDCPTCHGTGRVNRSRNAVEVAERYADGLATEEELQAAYINAMLATNYMQDNPKWHAASSASWCAQLELPRLLSEVMERFPTPQATQASLLRDIFGNPFRPVRQYQGCCSKCMGKGGWHAQDEDERWWYDCPECSGQGRLPILQDWLTSTVVQLAQAIYDERAFDRMPYLGDALEEAGCCDEAILRHCHGVEVTTHSDGFTRFGPMQHVRGCFVVDLILGKK